MKFQHDRHNAERIARKILKSNNTTSREESSLNEIYNHLPEEYSHCKDKLKALEIEREIKSCKANPVLKQVYDWCKAHGKRILIISDMYLPLQVIRDILISCGYDGWDKLYLSSDIGLRKSSGKLFTHVIQNAGINPKRHIHIGDSWKGDYLRALQAGMSAYKITRQPARSKYTRTLGLKRECREQYEKYQTVINNHIAPDWDEYYQYGFEVVGLMLYGLCCWLHERFVQNKHDKVFFLARDGYLMQEAYNKLFGEQAVSNSYLYVSRNSLLMPRLWMHPELADILDFVTTFEALDVNQLCDILDIDTSQAYAVWENCGLGLDERMPKKQFIHDNRVNEFFIHFREDIIRKSREKFELLVSYMRQEGFCGNVAVVDIGWVGSMQKFLSECASASGIDARIYCYYLGFKPGVVVEGRAESYIPLELLPAFFCTSPMEYPFTKIAGSTRTYSCSNDGQVVSVLDDYEFSGTEDEEHIVQMQRGAIDLIELMIDGYGFEHADYSAAYARMRSVTKSPTLRETTLLGDLHGINHGNMKYSARPDNFMKYVIHPGKFKSDFVDSGWKMGFLKRFLKLPLPYNTFLSILRSLLEKRYK